MKLSIFIFIIASFALIVSERHNSVPPISTNDRGPASFFNCFETFNKIVAEDHRFINNMSSPESIVDGESLTAIEDGYGNASFFQIHRQLNNDQVTKANEKILTIAENTIKEEENLIDDQQAQEIYDAMVNSKVNQNHKCYDPKGKTGFCFARAAIVHNEAIEHHIPSKYIRKVWVVGDMLTWGHHVATMIFTKDGWMVIDKTFKTPVTLRKWYSFYDNIFFKMYRAVKFKKKLMLFTSQAGRYGPDTPSSYTAMDFFNAADGTFNRDNDFYKGYFHDYFEEKETAQLLKNLNIETEDY